MIDTARTHLREGSGPRTKSTFCNIARYVSREKIIVVSFTTAFVFPLKLHFSSPGPRGLERAIGSLKLQINRETLEIGLCIFRTFVCTKRRRRGSENHVLPPIRKTLHAQERTLDSNRLVIDSFRVA